MAYLAFLVPSKLIHTKASRAGLPSQRNQGLELVSLNSEYVMFLDDDVILKKDFCENILKTFRSKDNIIGVAGVISNYRVSLLNDLLLKLFMMRGKNEGRFLPSGYVTVPTAFKLKRPTEVEFISGGLSCYRLSAIKGMRFDPEYERFTGHAYCEDLDFSYRASQRGKLVITPYARAIHNESPTARPDDYNYGIAQIVNRARLVKKIWGNSKYHWACFSWAIFGQIILNSAMTINARSPKRVLGNLAGIKYTLQRFKDI
jgi:GT2 family glycosyltransferase